jgi:hypothetical protein
VSVHRTFTRSISLLLTATALAGLTACGSDGASSKPAPGTPENPLVAKPPSAGDATSEGGAAAPGFDSLVDQQRATRVEHDGANPCALVTKAQAQAILGAKLIDPLVAPQGPTCIYRDRAGRSFATISIQSQDFAVLRSQVRRAERVEIADKAAVCGMHGQPTLYLPFSRGRVLSVAAPCDVAARLARRAVPRLP